METAINIGYACSLLTNDQQRLMIFSETPELLEAEHRDDPDLPAITEREVRLGMSYTLNPKALRSIAAGGGAPKRPRHGSAGSFNEREVRQVLPYTLNP